MVSELETLYPGKVILYCVKEGSKLKLFLLDIFEELIVNFPLIFV